MNTMNPTALQFNTTISIDDLKKRKVIFVICDDDDKYMDLLKDIFIKSYALNIGWEMKLHVCPDGRFIALIKKN